MTTARIIAHHTGKHPDDPGVVAAAAEIEGELDRLRASRDWWQQTGEWWHKTCHEAWRQRDFNSKLVEVERAENAALAAKVARAEALAREAVESVGAGGHSHWRVGGPAGDCGACESAARRQAELRAALADEAGQP